MSTYGEHPLAGGVSRAEGTILSDQPGGAMNCSRSLWRVARLVTTTGSFLPTDQIIQRRRIAIVNISTGRREWSGTCNFINNSIGREEASSINERVKSHADMKITAGTEEVRESKRDVLDDGSKLYSGLGDLSDSPRDEDIEAEKGDSSAFDKDGLLLAGSNAGPESQTDADVNQTELSKRADTTTEVLVAKKSIASGGELLRPEFDERPKSPFHKIVVAIPAATPDLSKSAQGSDVTADYVTGQDGRLQSEDRIEENNSAKDTQMDINQYERKDHCAVKRFQSELEFQQAELPMDSQDIRSGDLSDTVGIINIVKTFENDCMDQGQQAQTLPNGQNIASGEETLVGIQASSLDAASASDTLMSESGQLQHSIDIQNPVVLTVQQPDAPDFHGVTERAARFENNCTDQGQQNETDVQSIASKKNEDQFIQAEVAYPPGSTDCVLNVCDDRTEQCHHVRCDETIKDIDFNGDSHLYTVSMDDPVEIEITNVKNEDLQMLPEVNIQPLLDTNDGSIAVHQGPSSMKECMGGIASPGKDQHVRSQLRVQEFESNGDNACKALTKEYNTSGSVLSIRESADDTLETIQHMQSTFDSPKVESGGDEKWSVGNGGLFEEKKLSYTRDVGQVESNRQTELKDTSQLIGASVQRPQPYLDDLTIHAKSQTACSISYSPEEVAVNQQLESTAFSQTDVGNWSALAETPCEVTEQSKEVMYVKDNCDSRLKMTESVVGAEVWQENTSELIYVHAAASDMKMKVEKHLQVNAVPLQCSYGFQNDGLMKSMPTFGVRQEVSHPTENKAILSAHLQCASDDSPVTVSSKTTAIHGTPMVGTCAAEEKALDFDEHCRHVGAGCMKEENTRTRRHRSDPQKSAKVILEGSVKHQPVVNQNVWLSEFAPEVVADEELRAAEWQSMPKAVNSIPDQLSQLTAPECAGHHFATNPYDYTGQSAFDGRIVYPSPNEWEMSYYGTDSMVDLVGANVTLATESSERTAALACIESDRGDLDQLEVTSATCMDHILNGVNQTDTAQPSIHNINPPVANRPPLIHSDTGEYVTESFMHSEAASMEGPVFPVNNLHSFLATENGLDVNGNGVSSEVQNQPADSHGQPPISDTLHHGVAIPESSSFIPPVVMFPDSMVQDENAQSSMTPIDHLELSRAQTYQGHYNSPMEPKYRVAEMAQPACIVYAPNQRGRNTSSRPRRRKRQLEHPTKVARRPMEHEASESVKESLARKLLNGGSDRPSGDTGTPPKSTAVDEPQISIKRPRLTSVETPSLSSPSERASSEPALYTEGGCEVNVIRSPTLCATVPGTQMNDCDPMNDSSPPSNRRQLEEAAIGADLESKFSGEDIVSAVDAQLDEAHKNFEFTTWENFVCLVEHVQKLTTLRKHLIERRQQDGKENMISTGSTSSSRVKRGLGIGVDDIVNHHSVPGNDSFSRHLQEKQAPLPLSYGVCVSGTDDNSVQLRSSIVGQIGGLTGAYVKARQSDGRKQYTSKGQSNFNNNHIVMVQQLQRQQGMVNGDSLLVQAEEERKLYEHPSSSPSTSSDATVIVDCLTELLATSR